MELSTSVVSPWIVEHRVQSPIARMIPVVGVAMDLDGEQISYDLMGFLDSTRTGFISVFFFCFFRRDLWRYLAYPDMPSRVQMGRIEIRRSNQHSSQRGRR